MDKSTTGCWKSRETLAWSTDLQVAADHKKVPHWRKWLTGQWSGSVTEWSVKSHARQRLLVKMWNYHHQFGSCLLLEHSIICKKCKKKHLNFSVKRFRKSVKIWRNYLHNRVARFWDTMYSKNASLLLIKYKMWRVIMRNIVAIYVHKAFCLINWMNLNYVNSFRFIMSVFCLFAGLCHIRTQTLY